MQALDLDHLIIGTTLVGMTLADQLLKRGARRLMLVDSEPRLAALRGSETGWIIRGGGDAEEIEARGAAMLENWGEHWDSDPGFERLGSRWIGPDPDSPTTFPGDGVLNRTQLVSTLNGQIRKRGARIALESEVNRLEVREGVWHFQLPQRSGRARRLYLAGGRDTPRLARTLEIGLGWRSLGSNEVELDVDCSRPARLLRLKGPDEAPVDSLLVDDDGVGTHRAQTHSWYESGNGRATMRFISEARLNDEEVEVDWALWRELRSILIEHIPELDRAAVRRAQAHRLYQRPPHAPVYRPLGEDDAPGWVAGGFGAREFALAIGVGERLAEISIGSKSSDSETR